jgi:hypothetical protein
MTINEQEATERLSPMEAGRKGREEAALAKLAAEGKELPTKDEQALETSGWLCVLGSLFIPIIGLAGLIIGTILASKPGKASKGASILILSILVSVVSSTYWYEHFIK